MPVYQLLCANQAEYPISKVPNWQSIQLAKYPIGKVPNWQSIQLAKYPIGKVSNRQSTQLAKHPIRGANANIFRVVFSLKGPSFRHDRPIFANRSGPTLSYSMIAIEYSGGNSGFHFGWPRPTIIRQDNILDHV